jgi:hypothetical protein
MLLQVQIFPNSVGAWNPSNEDSYQLVESRRPRWIWDDSYLEGHCQACPRQKQARRARIIWTRDSVMGLAKEAQNDASVWMEEVVSTVFVPVW